MIYYAETFGISCEKEIGKELNAAFDKMKESDEDKILVFEKGTYKIDTKSLSERIFHITNTTGDSEFTSDETPHLTKAAMYLNGIKNLTVKGNGSTFLIDGKCINIAIEECENIAFEDMKIDVINPALFEFCVSEVKAHTVSFTLNKSCKYKKENGEFFFYGEGYKEPFYNKKIFYAPALVKKETPNTIERCTHPFKGAFAFEETSPYNFKAKYFSKNRFHEGDRYYLFSTRRDNVGIFVNSCKNFKLKDFTQNFNYSLALVCQKCENITVDGADFSASKKSGKLMSSLADFMQICQCKGKIEVTNSNFCGACDDVINVHGIHTVIESINGNTLTLKFKHPQTHGFNPYLKNDEIEYINRDTLLSCGKAKILSSKLIDENTVEVVVSSVTGAKKDMAVEDVTLCPDLYFASNTLKRITTRGILVTTRGKVVIENNLFQSFNMPAILISDDAKSWYESGKCKNVTIKGNTFENCNDYYISVLPENGKNKEPVHENITIEKNNFKSKNSKGIYLKCAKNVKIVHNSFLDENKKVKTERCVNVDFM